MKMPSDFRCPDSLRPHLEGVFAGEYDVPGLEFEDPITILDIGANAGSFARWALERWKGAHVHCYEPGREAFGLLEANLAEQLEFEKSATLHRCAVGDPASNRLYLGQHNLGEATLRPNACSSTVFEEVEVISPGALPKAHILKMDCEGSEGIILAGLAFVPLVVLMEYHSENLRRLADHLLRQYTLVGSQVYEPGRGVVKYVHPEVFGR